MFKKQISNAFFLKRVSDELAANFGSLNRDVMADILALILEDGASLIVSDRRLGVDDATILKQTVLDSDTSASNPLSEPYLATPDDAPEVVRHKAAVRGAKFFVSELISRHRTTFFNEFQWFMTEVVESVSKETYDPQNLKPPPVHTRELVLKLQMLAHMLPSLDAASGGVVVTKCHRGVLASMFQRNSLVREKAAEVMVLCCERAPRVAYPIVITTLLPSSKHENDPFVRLGAVQTIDYILMWCNSQNLLPYLVFIVGSLLSRLSDDTPRVRAIATRSFSTALGLFPLEENAADPDELSEALMKEKLRLRYELKQLTGAAKFEEFYPDQFVALNIDNAVVAPSAVLRKYQRDGLSWLYFLNRFHLNGVLCDDMGLGKTLQTLLMLACDSQFPREASRPLLPHLVVCPAFLVPQWANEVTKFLGSRYLVPLTYYGRDSGRILDAIRVPLPADSNYLVITSYDRMRSDIDLFCKESWNYMVLDEGHIIRNPKSAVAKSCKQVRALHR